MSNLESLEFQNYYETSTRPLSAQVAAGYAGHCVTDYAGVVDYDPSTGLVTTLEDGTMPVVDFWNQVSTEQNPDTTGNGR